MRKTKCTILRERANSLASKKNLDFLGKRNELVSFRLNDESYAISSLHIGEVFPLKEITKTPGVPGFVVGIINLRGRMLSVINPKVLLNLPEGPEERDGRFIVTLRSESMEFGLMVDPPLDVISVASLSLDPPIPSSSEKASYVAGLLKDVIVLNGSIILSDPDLVINKSYGN